uniref:Uncharacterized protein n=1 Tax=viral metagenome TaxID=1070528 RepID=A0A6M3KXT2_9ZZZZ
MGKLSYNDAQMEIKALRRRIHGASNYAKTTEPVCASDREEFYFLVSVPYNPKPRLHMDGSTH